MMRKHVNITVKGLVQGVGFRNAAKREARFLGIRGFVRNKPDGSVYIEAEGEQSQIALFVQWCRKGPAFAEVDEILVEEDQMVDFISFETRY